MNPQENKHKDYTPHIEFGLFVWYKTTRSKTVGKTKGGREVRAGTLQNRVCTTATTMEEAIKQLDRYLEPRKKDPEAKAGPGQQSLF